MSTPPPVLFDVDGAVAVITLNRPERLNAIDFEMAGALLATLETIAGRPELRAVVVTGSGRAFMAGGDLSAFHADPAGAPQTAQRLVGTFQKAVRVLAALDKPVIAAIRGAAAGGGMSLAMACDLVVAGQSAKLSFAYLMIGTAPDGGLSYGLPRMVGPRKALEIALLGEPVAADEALRLGLVTRVVADEAVVEEAMAMARRLATLPAPALGRTKALFRSSWSNSLDQQLDAELAAFVACAGTEDFRERIAGFFKKK